MKACHWKKCATTPTAAASNGLHCTMRVGEVAMVDPQTHRPDQPSDQGRSEEQVLTPVLLSGGGVHGGGESATLTSPSSR